MEMSGKEFQWSEKPDLWQQAQKARVIYKSVQRALPRAGQLNHAELSSWEDVAAVFFFHFHFFRSQNQTCWLLAGVMYEPNNVNITTQTMETAT